MIEAKILEVNEQKKPQMDSKERLTPVVEVVFFDTSDPSFVIAATQYWLRKDSAVEDMDDVLVRVKGEIERLSKTDVVRMTKDPQGNEVPLLERDTIAPGTNVEATPDKNYQVELK